MAEESKGSATANIITRKVVVVTGFGGERNVAERRAILHVTRLKFLVEHMTHVLPQGRSPDTILKYKVDVLKAPIGYIPDDALTAIDRADVLIALITEQNINVIYEIAIRNLLHDETIILLSANAGRVLPIYLQSMAHIEYEKVNPPSDEKAILDNINSLADSPSAKLSWRTLHKVPEEILPLIKENDDRLVEELQVALQEMEDDPPPRPSFLRNLVQNLDPGRLLSMWTTYVPFSVLRIKWNRRSLDDRYQKEDMDGEPVVYSANSDYLKLFDMAGELPDPNGPNPLTFTRLVKQIEPFVSPYHMSEFVKDQDEASQAIIYNNRFAKTKVPIHLNGKHDFFPNTVYLPQLVARRVVGDAADSPHSMYIFVALIEDFFPLPDTDDNERTDEKNGAG